MTSATVEDIKNNKVNFARLARKTGCATEEFSLNVIMLANLCF